MRALRTLPTILALQLACTHGISPPGGHDRNVAGLRRSALRDREGSSSRQRPQHLTPSQSCKKNETVIDCERLLALLPRPGGARNKEVLKKNGGWLPEALQEFSAAERAVAVNAVSWAAVVGGTVLWSRDKMGSDGGACLEMFQVRLMVEASLWSMISFLSRCYLVNIFGCCSSYLVGYRPINSTGNSRVLSFVWDLFSFFILRLGVGGTAVGSKMHMVGKLHVDITCERV